MLLIILPNEKTFAVQEDEDVHSEINDELFSAIDDETSDALDSLGINDLNSAGAFNISIKSIIRFFESDIKSKIKSTLILFFEMLSIAFLVRIASFVKEGDSNSDILNMLSVSLGAVVLSKSTGTVISATVAVLDKSSKFLAGYVPVYASLIATSGNPGTAAVYNTVTLAFCEGISLFMSRAVIPVIGMLICLSIAFSMNPQTNALRFINAVNKYMTIVISGVAVFFSAFLSFKGILAGAVDSASVKGVRFLVSNFIPVVGAAISDAYSTFVSSINLIKGSAAVIGIIVILIISIPSLIELIITNLTFSALSASCDALNQSGLGSLYKGFATAVKLLSLIVIYNLFIVIVSTGLMLSLKGSG